MTATIPVQEPASFTKGDTVKWRISLPDYLPVDLWVLSYDFVQSADHQTVTATDNGDGTHLVTIDTTASAAFTGTGIYYWQAYVTKSGERYKVREGRIDVKPDFASVTTGFDARSHVKAVLDALEATILGKASKDQLSMTINGDTISNMTPADVIKWHSHYQQMYRAELSAEQIANGGKPGNIIKVRF